MDTEQQLLGTENQAGDVNVVISTEENTGIPERMGLTAMEKEVQTNQ